MSSPEKLQIGTVVSTKMDKTVIVRIDRSKRHRLYGKTLRTQLIDFIRPEMKFAGLDALTAQIAADAAAARKILADGQD